jgi:hypothetical protein
MTTNSIYFGGCAGQPDFEDLMLNLASIIGQAIADIAETGICAETVKLTLDGLAQWRKRPDAALWYGIPSAEGIVPE